MCRRHPSSALAFRMSWVTHGPSGLGADARDLNAAAGQVNQDQHGEASQAAWHPDLDSEEVGGGEHVPVGRETLLPGRALLAVGGGF